MLIKNIPNLTEAGEIEIVKPYKSSPEHYLIQIHYK
jgi:hypothetical protein